MGSAWADDDAAFVITQWVRFGLARHPRLLKASALADAITTIVTAPRGVHLNLIEVTPEASVEKR
jgi:NADP-dependent 3-hydroxy acid dehydrogenase YdfG